MSNKLSPIKTNVVAVVNEQEYFGTVHWYSSFQKIAEEAVAHFGIKATKRGETIPVQFYEIVAEKGKQQRIERPTVEVSLWYTPTQSEFEQEQNQLLLQLPEEFREAIRSKAWSDGHSAGFDEVLLHLRELIDILSPCITCYTNSINGNWRREIT